VLKREAYAVNLEPVLKRAAKLGVAVEHNAAPARLDLSDRNMRLAKEYGCKFVVNTDAHAIADLDKMRFGVTQMRRAWLTKDDVLNTLSVEDFLRALRKRA
jgi:DNA polymerase (family 10)